MSQENIEKMEIDFSDDAKQTWAHTCAMLSNAVKDRTAPFRTGNIAYVADNKPQIRTVVLRHVSENLKYIRFHTDYRAPKIQALLQNPNISMHFYAPSEKLQFIAEGVATLHHKDDIAQQAWDKTQVLSRRCYLSDHAPSDISDVPTSGFSDLFVNNNQTLEESEKGYDNFCVVRINIASWERLYLHRNGNRRIQFNWDDKKEDFLSQWLVP